MAGTALLLAEKILTGVVIYYDVYNVNRTVGGTTIYPNNYEHSAMRAYLNGLKYQYEELTAAQVEKEDYFGRGFLQTAFTTSAQALIAEAAVDNSAESTTDAGGNLTQATNYACANTTDKIFLLSEREATTSGYGFAAYDSSGTVSTRIRVTTDYAKATGGFPGDSSAGYGGWWRLRSPIYDRDGRTLYVYADGIADSSIYVNNGPVGVVPALCVRLQ